MKYILPEFHINPGYNCFFSCLYNTLAYQGAESQEWDVFFLCNGLDFEYDDSEGHAELKPNKKIKLKSYIDMIKDFSKKTELSFNLIQGGKAGDLINGICKALQQNKPVLLFLDSQSMDFHSSHESVSSNEHCVIVYGINIEENLIYLADPYVIDGAGTVTTYMGEYPIEKISKGIRYSAYFDDPEKARDLKSELHDSILQCLTDFLLRSSDGPIKGGGALLRCMEELYTYKDRIGEINEEDISELLYLFRIRFIFIFSYLIEMLSNNQKLQALKAYEAINALERLQKAWNKFIIKLVMAHHSISPNIIVRVSESGMNLIQQQNEIFAGLVKLFEAISAGPERT